MVERSRVIAPVSPLEREEGWGEVSIFCNAARYAELARNIAELDRTPQLHGEDIQMILATLRQLEETSSWALEVRLV